MSKLKLIIGVVILGKLYFSLIDYEEKLLIYFLGHHSSQACDRIVGLLQIININFEKRRRRINPLTLSLGVILWL